MDKKLVDHACDLCSTVRKVIPRHMWQWAEDFAGVNYLGTYEQSIAGPCPSCVSPSPRNDWWTP